MQNPKRDHGSVTWKRHKVRDLQAKWMFIRNLTTMKEEVKKTLSHVKPKTMTLILRPGGSPWAQRECSERVVLFTQLWAVQERLSRLRCSKPRHRCQGSIFEGPRGACYRCGRKRGEKSPPAPPHSTQPYRQGSVGKKEWGGNKPSGNHHHALKSMKGTPWDGNTSPKLKAAF